MCRVLAVALGLVVLGEAGAQQQSPESKVLSQWIGTWKTEFVNKRAEWNPKETKTTGTITCKWVLGRKFVEEVGSMGKDVEHRILRNYDPQKKSYRYWFFDANGTTGEGVGSWVERTKTMMWWITPGSGFTGTASHRFVDADTCEWTYVIKDAQGKVYLDYEAKYTRVKE